MSGGRSGRNEAQNLVHFPDPVLSLGEDSKLRTGSGFTPMATVWLLDGSMLSKSPMSGFSPLIG